MSRLLPLLCTAISMAGTVSAQIGRATIQGTVSDPQQTVIPGAAVRVIQVETNTSFTTTTNEAGYYVVPGVPVGEYSITAEHQGFKRGVRSGIVVLVGDQARVDIRL
ncbi:MAG: carboxypeptidase regulatory-like domain-containing protein, partial [Acidobacteria bacterium]|nr:carboxypeptidase regulatory-like domain-containing protein [Acidobacteriota bacterium]